jgi:hypothetical protein
MTMLNGIMEEVFREGADRVGAEIPRGMKTLLDELHAHRKPGPDDCHLTPAVVTLGKRLLTMSDSDDPDLWFELLGSAAGLLLALRRLRTQGEPAYDGPLDEREDASLLGTGLLEPVSRERLDEDLAWLAEREEHLEAHNAAVEVFLDLTASTRRDQREDAWRAWFGELPGRIVNPGMSATLLRSLFTGIAGWLDQTRDHRFLMILAELTSGLLAHVASAHGKPGLFIVMDTFGRSAVGLLERAAGRGEIDPAHEQLRQSLAALLDRLFDGADEKSAGEAIGFGVRCRTGPLTGHPVSRQDVAWRMTRICSRPAVAREFLSSLIAGFCLESVVLREDGRDAGPGVGEALSAFMGREWDTGLMFLVRALIRTTPLSPFHIESPSTRAHILALDPENQPGSYLHDLKERLLSRSGSEDLKSIESVLNFWASGSPEHLDNLASPESLTALPRREQDQMLSHLHQLLARLRTVAPVTPKQGVRWLARLPQAYYQTTSLVKVAGFPGCSAQALALLMHLLNVYRALVARYEQPALLEGTGPVKPEDLLERSRKNLESRQELLASLFGGNRAGDPTGRLEAFEHEMALVSEEDRVLEALVNQELRTLNRDKLKTAVEVLQHMLVNAAASGLGGDELLPAAAKLREDPPGEQSLVKLLQHIAWQVASIRNRLAGWLQPHVEDSTRRLMENPLAHPAQAYSGLLEAHRHQGWERAASELGEALVDDLLTADGSFLLMENFVHRILHMLQKY